MCKNFEGQVDDSLKKTWNVFWPRLKNYETILINENWLFVGSAKMNDCSIRKIIVAKNENTIVSITFRYPSFDLSRFLQSASEIVVK